MIDHISVAVRDLVIAERFYTAVLTPLGLFKVRDCNRIEAVRFLRSRV
jgi:catechol 2,3-dioxygenase-like lactoylglutathione lyase family enzyme